MVIIFTFSHLVSIYQSTWIFLFDIFLFSGFLQLSFFGVTIRSIELLYIYHCEDKMYFVNYICIKPFFILIFCHRLEAHLWASCSIHFTSAEEMIISRLFIFSISYIIVYISTIHSSCVFCYCSIYRLFFHIFAMICF